MILGRRSSSTADEADTTPVEEASPEGSARSETKGRPTPKRSEARQARRTGAPRNQKEAAALQRERNREARQRARQALITGDEKYLPPRDAGPERRMARDVVDSRFTFGQVFLAAILVFFFGGAVIANRTVSAITNLTGLVTLGIIIFDCARHGRAAKAAVTEKYGAASAAGITSYAFMRAMQPRRFRRPPPKVGRGGKQL